MIFSKILSAPGERHDRTVSHQNVISVKLLQSRFIQKYYRGFSSVLSFSIPILSSDFCLFSSAPYALPFDRIPDYGICINLGLDRMSILATMAVGQIFVRFHGGNIMTSMPVSLLRRMRPVWTYCWLSYCIEYVAVSASVIIWVPKSGESKSGQMVSEKVIWS